MRGRGCGVFILLACELGHHGWSGMGLKELYLPLGYSKDLKHGLMDSSPAHCLWPLSLMFCTAARFAHTLLFLVFILPHMLDLVFDIFTTEGMKTEFWDGLRRGFLPFLFWS